MKAVFVLCALVVAVSARPEEQQQYTNKYDGLDYKATVMNERLLVNYFNCLVEKGKCTPEGKELKTQIPDALQNECSKCTPRQKEGTEYIINYLMENKPEYWRELSKKYDPEGIYTIRYQDKLKKHS